MNLTELSKRIRFDNASKGFDPLEGGVDRYLLLAISEICEAQNELRDGRRIDEIYYEFDWDGRDTTICSLEEKEKYKVDGFGPFKPLGFPVEIADAIIRLLDICGKFEVQVVLLKGYINFKNVDEVDSVLLKVCREISSFHIYGEDKENAKVLAGPIGRLFALCDYFKIDIMKVIEEKLTYNQSRPPKHGRRF